MVSITRCLCLGVLIVGAASIPFGLHAQTTSADPVLVGAGDIATCSGDGDEATAALLDAIPGTVFTAGDNVYPDGTSTDFANCYEPGWGRHKARTRPAAGNHDYHVAGAAGYFDYFGAAAGNPDKGYYSYNRGAWRILVLNSNCKDVSCLAGSAQERWVRANLAANPTTCTLAIWHHPRFSSGRHGSSTAMQPIWQALYDAGADVVISGHDHNYERFAPQDPDGKPDPKGIREFVVGTGGAGLRPVGVPIANSQVRDSSSHGVLKLTLHPTSYDWEFVPVAGATFRDSGTAACVTTAQSTPVPSPVPSPVPTTTNYLRNWSFETDKAPVDGKPDHWSILPVFSRSSAIPAHNGSFVGQFSDAGDANHTLSQMVSGLTPGTTYTFTGWINIPAQNDANFSYRIQVRWINTLNSVVATDMIAVYSSPTPDWVRASKTIVAPAGGTRARVQVVVSSLNGSMYIDQFALKN